MMNAILGFAFNLLIIAFITAVSVALIIGIIYSVFLIVKFVWEGYQSYMSKQAKKRKQKTWWQKATPFKKLYVKFALGIGAVLFILFVALAVRLAGILLGLSEQGWDGIDPSFALAFLGTISGGVALFGGWLAILRTEENKRQNDIADKRNKTASEQNEITTEQNKIINKQNKIAVAQNKAANTQNDIANKQANTAEQGLITDRLSKATEGLGKNDATGAVVEVRLGALYALERIAKDSERDHIQIVEILCAYIRANSPSSPKDKTEKPKPLREDIHAAINIIGRRGEWSEGKERLKIEKNQGYRLNLKNCNLYDIDLKKGNLHDARLNGTDLRDATLIGADLSDAWLINANLSGLWIGNGDISGAWLDDAIIEKTMFRDTKTDNAYSEQNDFSKCHEITKEQLEKMFCGFETKIPSELEPRPKHWPTKKLSYKEFKKAREEWISEKRAKETKAKAKPSELVDLDNPPF